MIGRVRVELGLQAHRIPPGVPGTALSGGAAVQVVAGVELNTGQRGLQIQDHPALVPFQPGGRPQRSRRAVDDPVVIVAAAQLQLPEGLDGSALAARCAQNKVAVVPGNAFGDSGEGHVRISYSYSIGHLSEALHRIELFLQELGV